MKRLVLLKILILIVSQFYAQTPFPCFLMGNTSSSTFSQSAGNIEWNANCWEVITSSIYGPIILENDAKTTVRANKSIHLRKGFQARNYSSTGFAHFTLGTEAIEPFIMNLGSAVVGKHKKIEIGFRMPEEIETQVNNYLADPDNYIGLNPYDPAKINIVAEFNPQSGSGTRTRDGFYYEYFYKDYTLNETITYTWASNVNEVHQGELKKNNSSDLLKWRVRFAPDELGFWYGKIKIYINGSFYTDIIGINFECVASDEHGFLEVGQHKRQFKFHDDNKSYYAIGQNLTWPENCQYLHNEFNITNEDNRILNTGCGADDWISRFTTLGDAHGNFARIVFCQGNKKEDNITYKSSSEIEWEKLGDYQSRQNAMWVMDQAFDIAEQKGIFILMVPNIQDEFLGHWADNPYRSDNSLTTNNPNPINDVYQTRDFFTSNKARDYYKRKLRYIHARWGYGPHLAAYEMLSEMDNWSGMSGSSIFNNDDDFINDDDFRYKCESWQHNMYLYQKNFLNCKQLFSSSYKGGSNCWKISDYSPSPFNFLDFTSNHEYNAEKLDAFKRRGVRDKMLYDGIFQSGWDKPTNFGEMGIQNTQTAYIGGNPIPNADHNDIENCNEIIFHNAMWSTAFMSGFGAGIQWWTSENNTYRQLIFPALHNFFANVDFEVNDWRNHQSWKDIHFNPENNKIEVFANTSKTSQKVMGWIHQATYWWGNTIQFTCKDRNNYFNEIVANGEDDSYSNPIYFYGEKYKLTGLQLKRKYDFTYFRTTGNASVYKNETIKSNIFGQLNGRYPDNYPNSSETLWDVAFKAVLHGQTFREDSTIIEPIDTDTLLCSDDTIKIDGVFGDDIGGVKSYHWNFGNGQSSNLWHPVLVYDTAGTYLVTVIITDSLGYKDTLKQYIYKPNCEYENTRNSVINEDEILIYLNESNSNSFNLIIRPNPFDNFIYLNEKNGQRFNYTIFDLHGKAILNSLAKENSFEIDLSEFATGMYIIKIDLESNINYYKIIKTP
jgi:hypothetical protein